jgi:probable phosphoglycerate mutase
MHLILIRHGETTWNALNKVQGQADPPLVPNGQSQAQALGMQLQPIMSNIAAIYCSELQRARITAELIRGNSKTPLYPDSRLNSRDLGEFTGLTLKEIKIHYPELYKAWIKGDEEFCPPGGEKTSLYVQRTQAFLHMLKQTHSSSANILIVTHRENIGIILYLITGQLQKGILDSIKNCTPYEIDLN